MADRVDPKEAKTLSDILALVLDDQAGVSAAALQKLRERAAQDRITGGALKNLFIRLTAGPPESDELRGIVAAQAASLRELQQQVRNARARLEQVQRAREDEADRLADGRRGVLVAGLAGGAVAGGLMASVIGWLIGLRGADEPLRPVPPAAGAPPHTVPHIMPPTRDPADTAPPPSYPPEARERGEQGTVVLLVRVDADGHVGAIGVTQSAGADLDVAAQQAVREWRFRPAARDGVAVPSEIVLRFTFMLHK